MDLFLKFSGAMLWVFIAVIAVCVLADVFLWGSRSESDKQSKTKRVG